MRIGDNFTLNRKPGFPHPPEADGQTLRDSYVLTRETGEICARILRRLACHAEPQPGGFFLTGERGVGKTHLLRYLAGFLSNPKAPGWEPLHAFLGNDPAPRVALNSLFVEISDDPSIDLGRYLEWKIGAEATPSPFETGEGKTEMSGEQFAIIVQRAASDYSARSLGILVLDDISRRLDRITEPSKLEKEFQTLKILMESFANRGVLVFMVMDECHLKWESAMGIQMSILDSLGESCDFIWLSRNHIVEIIATALASKSDAQKLEIRGLLNRLRRKLPHLVAKAENFIDLYPIHPDVFYALFQLRSRLPRFSPLRFAQIAMEDVYRRPAENLVTLDYLFDHVHNDLKILTQFRSLLASYEHLKREVIPLLKPAVQLNGHLLLKVITLLTLCESQAPTVRALANSLLILDDSDFLPSYSLTSAILLELEQLGGKFLSVEGEMLDRRYRLLEAGSDASLPTAKKLLAQEDEFPLQFPVLVFEWLHSEIPAWLPDTSAKSARSSQSLAVAFPGRENGPKGLVYLKSIFDPLWSREDLVSLEESSYPWVLLVLSPYERFYEFEQALQELCAHLSRLLIWHPDIPTAYENDRLHKLSGMRQAVDAAKREDISPQERLSWNSARPEFLRILGGLYIDRGRLISASVQRCIGDEIENQTVAEYLSGQLSVLDAAFLAGVPGAVRLSRGAAPTSREMEKQALHWAALLSGKNDSKSSDSEEAKRDVLDWWFHVEVSGLATGLQQIPDAFLTVQFWDYVKAYEAYLESLRPVLIRLREADIEFFEAMIQVARIFNSEEERLEIWKQSLESLSGLLRWLPSFEHERNYLYSAVPTGQGALEEVRTQLLEMLDKPQQFLEALNRDSFEQNFLGFKKGYIDYYTSKHEDALHIIGNPEKLESKVDYIALRNLEMLSNLQYAAKSYLNRVRIIGKWVQANQCDLPVRDILESFPRCYCNFSPAASGHLSESVSQMNTIIDEGIHYFRSILRHCKMHVIQDLKTMDVDDLHSRQIAALLSNGRMVQLEPRTVEILNRIIQKHSKNFQAGIRSYKGRASATSK